MSKPKSVRVVLSGSGILYPLHAGALQALVEEGYEIEAITGVSGGAIVGGAVASGYAPGDELNELILSTLPGPNDLLDPNWIPLWNWGIYEGDEILGKFRDHMYGTFQETDIPFNALTVNVDRVDRGRSAYTVFGTERTPKADLPLAVRASMTFPFVFEPAEINGDRHVDGGVAAFFPVDIWGEGRDVVGFHVRGGGSAEKPGKGLFNILEYAKSLLGTMLEAINREHIEDARFARTVVLKSEVSPLHLSMTVEEAEKLIEAGYDMAQAKLGEMEASGVALS